jgi:hypothetical protein
MGCWKDGAADKDSIADFTRFGVFSILNVYEWVYKVYIEIPCPDQEVEVEVPTSITTKISAGYTLWKIIQALLAGFVVGVLLTLLYTAIKK